MRVSAATSWFWCQVALWVTHTHMEYPPNPTLKVRPNRFKEGGEEVVVVWPPAKGQDAGKDKGKEKEKERSYYNLQSLSSVLNDPTSPVSASKSWNPNGFKAYPSPFVPQVDVREFDKYLEELEGVRTALSLLVPINDLSQTLGPPSISQTPWWRRLGRYRPKTCVLLH